MAKTTTRVASVLSGLRKAVEEAARELRQSGLNIRNIHFEYKSTENEYGNVFPLVHRPKKRRVVVIDLTTEGDEDGIL